MPSIANGITLTSNKCDPLAVTLKKKIRKNKVNSFKDLFSNVTTGINY